MGILSVFLRPSVRSFNICASRNISASGKRVIKERISRPLLVSVQCMSSGEKRILEITASRFFWKKYKDSLHFYLMLGIIPLSILIFCVNIFIGPAELAEIPEGYEPKHWEHYPHPIQRFFSRYVYASPQQTYEKFLHMLAEEHDVVRWRTLENKVMKLMSERNDYQAWYYIPNYYGKPYRYARKEVDDIEELMGVK